MTYLHLLQHSINIIKTNLVNRLKRSLFFSARIIKLNILIVWIFVLLASVNDLFSQPHASYYNYTGDWESSTSWSPEWNTPIVNNLNNQITIYGFITCNNGVSYESGGLTVEDTLVINGDLRMGISTSIVIDRDAILIINGSLYIQDESQAIIVKRGAYLIVSGNVMVEGDTYNANFGATDSPPKIFIGGAIEPAELTDDDVNYTALDCTEPEVPYTYSGCTFGNLVDLSYDPIYSFYQSVSSGSSPIITTEPLDKSICENHNVDFILEANNVDSYQWEVDDGGGFVDLVNDLNISGANSHKLSLQNVPSTNNGYLYQCRITGNDASVIYSSTVALTVQHQVVADAGSNAAVCENSSYTVSDANVDYGNGTYSWTHNGNGSLANETTLTPTYTPDALDAGNTVTLTLTADGNADCAQSADQMNITVTNQVVADAGSNASICEGGTYTVDDADVSYGNGTYSWSH
uniref:hypothetical protein n=1 Tax=Saccharicrinis sp. 156 TaxID=3417574 RepID=UPI003D347BE5